ncbi:MAG: hypothetical protein ACOC6E_00135 [Thermodesulfobacteriota bacterium]
MVRLLVAAGIGLTVLLSAGCSDNAGKTSKAPSQPIGDTALYTFSAHGHDFLGNAQPLILPPGTSLRNTLVTLGEQLAVTYFSETYKGTATDIRFEVRRIEEIGTPSYRMRIAVINMVDKEEDALRYFFQGSAGAQTSFYMITAMFLQPQASPPLLDGLVLLYNGNLLPELDHINLSGILTPRLVRQVAERAIHRYKEKTMVTHDYRRAFFIPPS